MLYPAIALSPEVTRPRDPGYDFGSNCYVGAAGQQPGFSLDLAGTALAGPGGRYKGLPFSAIIYPHGLSNAQYVRVAQVDSKADPSYLRIDAYHIAQPGAAITVELYSWERDAWIIVGVYRQGEPGDGKIPDGQQFRQAGKVRCRLSYDGRWDQTPKRPEQSIQDIYAGLHYLTWS